MSADFSDHGQFESEFSWPKITVGFNWTRFRAEQWPIQCISMNCQSDFWRCCLPWYPRGKALRLSEVTARFTELEEDHRERILWHAANRVPGPLSLPAYSLPFGQLIVMDGCHRLSAMVIASIDFQVEFWSVQGPIDAACLADIAHWTQRDAAAPEP